MKFRKAIPILFVATAALLFSCKKEDTKDDASSSGLYFEFTIDGKEKIVIPEADILTSYYVYSTGPEFKIFAGALKSTKLLLIIPKDMSKPSSTPSGGTSYSVIPDGSVSLQGYPTTGYTFNSYNHIYQTAPPVADAIVVTSSELFDTNKGRIITGTINVTTVFHSTPDNIRKPYKIVGKFRVKHFFNGLPF